MVINFKFFKGRPSVKWKSHGGFIHPIEYISTGYIKLIMKQLVTNPLLLPCQNDGRTATEWYNIFDNELKRRNGETF